MLVSMLGLGGGGIRISSEYVHWLESLNAQKPEERTTGWVFEASPTEAFGFSMMDCISGDFARLDTLIPVDDDGSNAYKYRISSQSGFGGDADRAYAEISRIQDEAAREWSEYEKTVARLAAGMRRPPRPVSPITDFLRTDLNFRDSDIVIACSSLVGGTGRGVFKYIMDEKVWGSIFAKDNALKLMIGVVPPASELATQRVRETAEGFSRDLDRMLQDGTLSAVIVADYSLASSILDISVSETSERIRLRQARITLDFSNTEKSKQEYQDALTALESNRLWPRNVQRDSAVDAGIVLSSAGLFANAVSPLVDRSKRFEIREPKVFDYNDLRNEVSGSFIIPCYLDSSEDISSRDLSTRRFGDYFEFFGESPDDFDFDPLTFNLKVLISMCTSTGAMLPMPRMPQDSHLVGKAVEEGGMGVHNALCVIWTDSDSRDVNYAKMAATVGDFLRSQYGISSSRVLRLSGADPTREYTKDRFYSDAPNSKFKMWLYLMTKNQPISDGIKIHSL